MDVAVLGIDLGNRFALDSSLRLENWIETFGDPITPVLVQLPFRLVSSLKET
jgi:hypothetical protein